ncbi:hypothetical protein GCM10027168_37110 [Streptomyces capparidis]
MKYQPRGTEGTASRGPLPLLLLASGAAFLAVLDVTIVNLAVPDLAGDFEDADIADLSWVVTIYASLFAALLAPAGRLADVVGRRSLFVAGVGGFTLMSLLCSLAPGLEVLLAARALQGASAAAMIPASLAIVLADTPPERRRAAIGQWSAAGTLAAAVGPSLGGVLVDAFGWRSLFLINVPLGLALLLCAGLVPRTARTPGRRLPDAWGTALLGLGIGLLCLGITEGDGWGWTGPRTLACLAGGAAALGWTLLRSARHPVPAVETSLWRSRAFALSNAASFAYGAALYAWLLVGVLYVTGVWGYSELEAGLAMTPGALAATVTALYAGRLQSRWGVRPVVVGGGLLLAAVGLVTALTLPEEPDFLTYWLPLGVLVGIPMGLVTTGTSTAAALSVSPLRFAGATGLNQTARQVGGALGIATMATLLTGTDVGTGDFAAVYLFCAAAAALSALAGLGLAVRPPAPAAAPAAGRPAPAPATQGEPGS